MSRIYLPKFFIFVFLMSTLGLQAQNMEVTDATTAPFTPENLITNIFLGQGVEVLSVNYSGAPEAVGYFKNGQQAIGIDRGILLTSGRAAGDCNGGPFGANCLGNDFASNNNGVNNNDPDLSDIATGTLRDLAVYTIEFVPTGDTVQFKYVFASEEYPEFSCSSFNDVFGFFISGPGINGPFTNNGENIATIPGTTQAVSINNIHPQNGANCPPSFIQFYNDNNGIALQPVYDGYTDVFTATAVVTPCETYTIKLAVADVTDWVYDTGVFLEAKSFGAPTLEVETATVSLDGTVTEGCATGSITFSFPNAVETDYPLDYTILGTATNGVDYVEVPTDLFIPAGDSSITVEIIAIPDGIDEDVESIGIDIQRDICNRDTFWLYIRDNEILPPDLRSDTTVCQGQPVQLDGTLPIPLPTPPSFTNDQDMAIPFGNPTYSPINVFGVQPITLGPGVIRSVCVNIDTKWDDDLDLFLISPGGQFIELSSDNGKNCDDYDQVCFSPTATTPISDFFNVPPCPGGMGAAFNGGTWAIEGVWSDLWDGDYPTNGTWQLLCIDDQMGFDGTLLDWTITFEPLYQVNYRWEPSAGLSCDDCPDPIATPDTTTTYYLTAWDSYGCEVYDTVTIDVISKPETPEINCNNVGIDNITFEWNDVAGNNGYLVNVEGSGWVPPNNGNLSHFIGNLAPSDTITIEVVALSQCNSDTATATCFTPPCVPPNITLDNVQDVTCYNGSDGSIGLSANGGAGGYTWYLDTLTNTTGTFQNLPAGDYTVTVIDADDCPQQFSVTINQPEELILDPQLLANISCFGANDGSATLTVGGGVWPYSFNWTEGQTDSIATGLSPGAHAVTVTDDNGCQDSVSVEIIEPTLLDAFAIVDSVDCFGTATGEAFVQITGGTPDYMIQWDAAAGNATTELVQNLPAGSYQVNVTDDNGCQVQATATIEEPPLLTVDATATDLSCLGSGDGTATAMANGGTPGYAYLWSNGQSDPIATGLSATTYTVTVTDLKGCTATTTAAPSEPAALVISFGKTDVSCFGGADGSITATVTGGTQPYSYEWNGTPGDSSLSALPVGQYCLLVTDTNGCTAEDCIDIQQPDELQVTATTQDAGCFGQSNGTIDITVSGGTPNYNYQWDHGPTTQDLAQLPSGDYHLVVTDANGCTAEYSTSIENSTPISVSFNNEPASCAGYTDGRSFASPSGGTPPYNYFWSNGEAANPAVNLPGGWAFVTITDSEGCELEDSTFIEQPEPFLVNVEITDISCYGFDNGSLFVEVSGANPPFVFSTDGENYFGSPLIAQLPPGDYSLYIRDAKGCIYDTSGLVVVEPPELTLDLGPDTMVDYGTLLEIHPGIGGVDPANWDLLSYHWFSNNPQTPPVDSSARIGVFEVYSPTSASLTITDPNGCTAEDLINIFVRELRSIEVPTAFTPGNDGVNDLLLVHGNSKLVDKINYFRVFDRWGELLFEAGDFEINSNTTGWDGTFKGKPMPPGVYVWYLEVSFIDGSLERYSGHTTLIR
ncbi:MAG: hypothetical protein CMN32_16930 [Saprospirales bacterium]|nr:hypothetical protein [Saprospirales bacterium]